MISAMSSRLISVILILCLTEISDQKYQGDSDPVAKLQEYIQIDTSQDENIEKAVEFWKREARDLGLPIEVYEPDGKPIVVITWEGLNPSMPTIMLNSHMDVVSAAENEWTYPPFSAHIDENDNIYGRGIQDTKDIAIQYLEAIRRLKKDNITLLRTFHLTLMPDEEVGGYKGMKAFINTEEFLALNVGFALDEGYSSNNDTLFAFYEDRRPWQMEFTIYGDGGHGFTMPDNTAVEKANRFMSRVFDFRRQNMEIMNFRDSLDFEKYTSVNVNMVHSGSAVNVIPTNVTVSVDMRLSSDSDPIEMYDMIKSWMDEAGNDTTVNFIRREDISERTTLDSSNLYWLAMKDAVNDMGFDIVTLVCPATTDMLNLRNIGIPAVGFAPKLHTTSRIHDKDEYINVETFIDGIDFYYEILKRVGNVPEFISSEYNYVT